MVIFHYTQGKLLKEKAAFSLMKRILITLLVETWENGLDSFFTGTESEFCATLVFKLFCFVLPADTPVPVLDPV